MLIALLAGAVCVIIAILLFTPMFRHALLFRPVALFFFFEGIWILFDYLISQLWPGVEAMQWVHYAGVIIFGGYLIVCLICSRPKKEKKKSKKKKTRSRKTATEE
ncbi:MAG: hypothetical protein II233_07755 [Clostridia bacterium]|nr:hypothetical protein [Clostridia bacterium]MEE1124589.1 hypothetical protein [Acutalibacteraceae bacterium]